MKINKNILLSIVSLSCSLGTVNIQKESEIIFNINNVENYEWHMKGDYFYDWHIKFNKKEKSFKEYFIGEGCGGYSGSYSISNELLILKKDTNDKNDCIPKGLPKIRKCNIKIDYESSISPITLDCGREYKYWNSDYLVKPNLIRKINDEKILTLGLSLGKTTERVRVRENPTISSKFYKCWEMKENEPEIFNSLNTNKNLILIGRTLEKSKINQWNNYWYYVYIGVDWYEGCDSRYGWIFGEFVDIK
jgi:hypothetical protein